MSLHCMEAMGARIHHGLLRGGIGFLGVALCVGWQPDGCRGETGKHPNIVFVFADQLRACGTGYGGDENVRTPRIDRLAANSINFRNAVSVCPVCTPYRASLLTGRFPTTTGMFVNDAYMPERELTIAEVLKAAGYDTAYIGKWHLDGHGRSSYIPPERRQGFDYWKGAECDHNYNRSHYFTGVSEEKLMWEGYDAFAQTADAKRYLADGARSSRPFVLFVSYGIPHFPHGSAPKNFMDMYPAEKIKFRPNVPEEMRTPKVIEEARGYLAHTSALDECIGQVVEALDCGGLAENTILVFTSDHGEMMGSHGIRPYTKHVPWDESARVPFLVRYPAAHGPRGRVTVTPLTTPDIMPTLLSLAGVVIPDAVEGRDLSAVVRDGRDIPDHDALYMAVAPFAGKELNREYRAIRTPRFTYVRGIDGPWMLFDDREDPFQMNNLIGQPPHAAIQRDMEARLDAALKAARDDFRPASEYVKAFGYELAPHGSLSYAPGAKVQSPLQRKVGPAPGAR